MVPSPRWWWDLNNNGVIDESDSNIGYSAAGGSWTAEKHNDVWTAATQWRSNTRWDPFDASGGGTAQASVRVDGGLPGPCLSKWTSIAVGATCNLATPVYHDGLLDYYDLYDSDVAINLTNYPIWNFGGDDAGYYYPDFRGVLTHEIGHGARLKDVYPPNCGNPTYTMCGDKNGVDGIGPATQVLRSLTTHDINAANVVYPV